MRATSCYTAPRLLVMLCFASALPQLSQCGDVATGERVAGGGAALRGTAAGTASSVVEEVQTSFEPTSAGDGSNISAEESFMNGSLSMFSQAELASSGHMTMWSDQESTIVGGACQFANKAVGGMGAPSAVSPNIQRALYCAANKKMWQGGDACGRCYKISYDGSPATDPGRPGSEIIQVVDSGASAEFDCQMTAFHAVTGAITGIFPISYERVPCQPAPGGQRATVLSANPWFMIVVFSNGVNPARKATFIQNGKQIPMSRRAATFTVQTGGHTGPISFRVVDEGRQEIHFNDCFQTWPQPVGASCASA